jgi:hypothetical protein
MRTNKPTPATVDVVIHDKTGEYAVRFTDLCGGSFVSTERFKTEGEAVLHAAVLLDKLFANMGN